MAKEVKAVQAALLQSNYYFVCVCLSVASYYGRFYIKRDSVCTSIAMRERERERERERVITNIVF